MGKPTSRRVKGASTKRSRGAYGSKRHIPDKIARQTAARQRDPRIRSAMEQVEDERRALEARIAHERAHPTVGKVTGAQWRATSIEEPVETAAQLAPPTRPRIVLPAFDAEGNESWTLGQARSMLRHGYHLFHVQRMTGFGAKWFDDMAVDADGFGLPL